MLRIIIYHSLKRADLWAWVEDLLLWVNGCTPQISIRGRYSISNINQQLTICQQMLRIWCIHLFLFLQSCEKNSLLFNLADLNWPKEQSTSIRYQWCTPHQLIWLVVRNFDFSPGMWHLALSLSFSLFLSFLILLLLLLLLLL